MTAVIASAMLGLTPGLAMTHHAFPDTYNTSQVVEVSGRVVDLDWTNPHVEWVIELADGNRWGVESNSVRSLERQGITASLIAVGSQLRVAGFPARNGDANLFTTNLQLPGGPEYVLRPGSEPRWTEPERQVTGQRATQAESIVVTAADAHIEVVVMAGELSIDRTDIETWVANAADVVIGYYGQFPVAAVQIGIEPVNGSRVRGRIWAGSPAYIQMSVGEDVSPEDLHDDWRLIHELIHLAFPQIDSELLWIEEGLATYVEPIARAKRGAYPPEAVWDRFLEGMPFGAQQLSRSGLNEGRGWSRTYWGGALFCLLADVAIRNETNLRFGLEDALAGVVSAGGNIEQAWTIDEILEVADSTVGTTTLSTLYSRVSREPLVVELEEIWYVLGVRSSAGSIFYDDSAPGAAIRRSILH